MKKTAVITGSSSGIGKECALALARDGYVTYATMRNAARGDGIFGDAIKEGLEIKTAELDVDSEESVRAAVSKITKEAGRIDVLVNNAGYGIFGSVEDVSIKQYKAQFETNFFGVIRMIQGVAPLMRGQGGGHIINISSVAGRIGFPGTPAYISSKFALEGLSESIRYELGQFGVRVVMIEPGVIKTNFFDAMRVAEPGPDSPYGEMTQKVISGIKMMAQLGTEPGEVAAAVLRAAKQDEPLPRYVVGNDASMFLEARRAKSDVEFENYLKKELFSE